MAYPKVAIRLRPITVEGVHCKWRLAFGAEDSELLVYGPQSGRQVLIITMTRWQDVWPAAPEQSGNGPRIIRPTFVRAVIEFGLAEGWEPGVRGPAFDARWDGRLLARAG